MSDVKVKLNRRAVKALLQSEEVGKDLSERGQRIASAAGAGFTTSRRVGTTRQRVLIYADTPEALAAEARDHVLLSALDAGR